MMKRDWLWDKKISINGVKKILKNPQDERFLYYTALLLSRKNNPKEVFKGYISPDLFCNNWQSIKKVMRKNKWLATSIEFWQAVYEKLREKYKPERKAKKPILIEPICKRVGENIKRIRKEKKLTQKQLAQRLKVAQQLISRIENGYENISLITLKNIASSLDIKIVSLFK